MILGSDGGISMVERLVLLPEPNLDDMDGVLDRGDKRDRLFIHLPAAGFDARQVKDIVDEMEQIVAGTMDVAGIGL